MAFTCSVRSAPRLRLRLWTALAVLAVPAGAVAAEMSQGHTTPLPRPRDGNVAVAEELEAARRAGTIHAYDLFLARHPAHPLARTARRERRALTARNLPAASHD